MNYKKTLCILTFFAASFHIFAQDILTASDFFKNVAEKYSTIEDYQADITITRGNTEMEGLLFYKTPGFLRINFSTPENQVLVFDGKVLTIYIPRYRVSMSQKISEKDQITTGASIASKEGLSLLRQNYTVAYLENPKPILLDENSKELVTKLKFVWRSTQEGFKQIVIAISQDGYIRQVIGTTPDNNVIKMDFNNILLNQNIPDVRFEYDSPPSANVFENFLFGTGE